MHGAWMAISIRSAQIAVLRSTHFCDQPSFAQLHWLLRTGCAGLIVRGNSQRQARVEHSRRLFGALVSADQCGCGWRSRNG
jgi:hypothetical protein